MARIKSSNWFLTGLHGLLIILFGFIAILFPKITLAALAIYFALSILLGGAVLSYSAVRFRALFNRWHLLLLEGVIGILLGILILSKPDMAAASMVTIFGAWIIFLGLLFLASYFRTHMTGANKALFLITGILSLLLGLTIALNPFESTRAVAVLIGIYAVSYGIYSTVNTSSMYK
jgi:uncharacterized membrane protein HdeD (DUF308 family)